MTFLRAITAALPDSRIIRIPLPAVVAAGFGANARIVSESNIA